MDMEATHMPTKTETQKWICKCGQVNKEYRPYPVNAECEKCGQGVEFGTAVWLTVETAIELFPATFGLRAFPGKVFRISVQSSYPSQDDVVLYTEVQDGDKWLSFAKGSVEEMQRNVVPL